MFSNPTETKVGQVDKEQAKERRKTTKGYRVLQPGDHL